MDYFFFVLLNAVLFVRPGDFVPFLAGVPVYNLVILLCLAVSFGQLTGQLSSRSLSRRPITVCVVGLLPAVILSHVTHAFLQGAVGAADQFYKVVLYFLLLVGVLNTPRRLSGFLNWLCLFIAVTSVLALLTYHGVFELKAFEPIREQQYDEKTGEIHVDVRLCGSGIFANPNDISRILILAMLICLYRITDRRLGPLRFLWIAPLWLFNEALSQTYSRGAFIGLLAGIFVLFCSRFGRKGILLTAVVLPLAFVIFAGRTTSLSTGEGTSQQRIQLWSTAYEFLRESPLFGIGMFQFADRNGLEPHNSFVQCYAELGFLGGTLFCGAYYCAILGICKARQDASVVADAELVRFRPYLLAIIASYAVGTLTSNRSYQLPTYMLHGLAAAYIGLMETGSTSPTLRSDWRMLKQIMIVSLTILLLLYFFMRLFVDHAVSTS
jgi:hypothetical protein